MTLHSCLSVRGVLNWPKSKQRTLAKMFLVDGKPCSDVEAMRDHLMDCLAQGMEVLPLGEPCEGFDVKKGCPGHA